MTKRPLQPHLFVIFGATGDLTSRKLLPALFHLVESAAEKIVILGAATTELDDKGFRNQARRALADAGIDEERATAWCDECVHYHLPHRHRGTGRGWARPERRLDPTRDRETVRPGSGERP